MSLASWKFRKPPNVENVALLKLCLMQDTCILKEKCQNAHSEEELDEWKKRQKFREKATKYVQNNTAKDLSHFRQEILKKLDEEDTKDEGNRQLVLVELSSIAGVYSSENLFVMHVEKEKEVNWVFTVKIPSKNPNLLKRIFLMGVCEKFNFTNVYIRQEKKLYELPAKCALWENEEQFNCDVLINVNFSSAAYGNFHEEIVFDFGDYPKIYRKIGVQVANDDMLKKFMEFDPEENIENELTWLSKYDVILFDGSVRPAGIATKFPLPKNIKNLVEYDAFKHLDVRLTKQNYRQRLHTLLFVEEFERRAHLQSYNFIVDDFAACAEDKLNDVYEASINFDEFVVKQLIRLVGVNGKLLIRVDNHSKGENKFGEYLLYEAAIKNVTAEHLVLCLSKELFVFLKSSDVPVKILACFCLIDIFEPLHYAVENIDLNYVFPNLDQFKSLPLKLNSSKDKSLSLDQYRAVKVICDDKLKPPVLLLGPFGTGKTKTLAYTVKELVSKSSKDNRVLICTHSNSAADLFIEEYFDPFHSNGTEFDDKLIPLRINWTLRYQGAVSDRVLTYCLVDYNTGLFKEPTKDDLDSHYIIICTLNTAITMTNLDLPDNYFTHILIDEAAQAIESECLIPFLLAGPETTIVLSGDHLQMGETLMSETARNLNLGMSLLERLFKLYETGCEYKLQLIENFRSYKAIVDMPSKLFYGNSLCSKRERPAGTPYPILFFQVNGEEKYSKESPSYVNMEEAEAIAQYIEKMSTKWKGSKDEFDSSTVCVVTFYKAQVRLIRQNLRKNHLSVVRVESVNNIQGLEFDHFIISTVRTYHQTAIDDEGCNVDMGFLTNTKLLNTALTRPKYSLAVFGDPTCLCLIGKCKPCWGFFIDTCFQNNSYIPMDKPFQQVVAEIAHANMVKDQVDKAKPVDTEKFYSFIVNDEKSIVSLNKTNSLEFQEEKDSEKDKDSEEENNSEKNANSVDIEKFYSFIMKDDKANISLNETSSSEFQDDKENLNNNKCSAFKNNVESGKVEEAANTCVSSDEEHVETMKAADKPDNFCKIVTSKQYPSYIELTSKNNAGNNLVSTSDFTLGEEKNLKEKTEVTAKNKCINNIKVAEDTNVNVEKEINNTNTFTVTNELSINTAVCENVTAETPKRFVYVTARPQLLPSPLFTGYQMQSHPHFHPNNLIVRPMPMNTVIPGSPTGTLAYNPSMIRPYSQLKPINMQVEQNHLVLPAAISIQHLHIKHDFLCSLSKFLNLGETTIITSQLNSLVTQIEEVERIILFSDLRRVINYMMFIDNALNQIFLTLVNFFTLDTVKTNVKGQNNFKDFESVITKYNNLVVPIITIDDSINNQHCLYLISLIRHILYRYQNLNLSSIFTSFLKSQFQLLEKIFDKIIYKRENLAAASTNQLTNGELVNQYDNDERDNNSIKFLQDQSRDQSQDQIQDQKQDICVKEYKESQERKAAQRVPSPIPHFYQKNEETLISPPYTAYPNNLMEVDKVFEGIMTYKRMVILDGMENALYGVVQSETLGLKFEVFGYRNNNRALPGDKVLVEATQHSSKLPPTAITRGRVIKTCDRYSLSKLYSCKQVKEFSHGILVCTEGEFGPLIFIEKPKILSDSYTIQIIDWPLDSKYPLGKLV